MGKLNPSKIVKSEDRKCAKCQEEITIVAAKCEQCNELFHIQCTGMSVHMGIKYLSTRVTYSCKDCVKVKTDGYEEILKLIYSVSNNNSATSDDASVNTPHGDQTGQINQLIRAVTDIRGQMDWITKKIGNETQQQRSNLYSDVIRENREQRKTTTSNQAVFVKCKEGTNQVDENELVTALKSVPTIAVKKIKDNTVKLILPNEDTKGKALTALAESNLSETHEFRPETKLKPKISIPYVSNTIEDEDAVNFIKEINRHFGASRTRTHTQDTVF